MLGLSLGSWPFQLRLDTRQGRLGRTSAGGTATLGCGAPASANVAMSMEPVVSLFSGSSARHSGLMYKCFEISTYESIRLKLSLESILTERRARGTIGWNLTFRKTHQDNQFRMISLQDVRNQLLCNYILAKKGGGTLR